MNNHPLISIIVPVYNVERYLPKCVESIINQTFQDWELILVNDGSTDRSGDLCDNYAIQDIRIRVFHKENTGLADTRNIGLSVARADFVGFVDSDDWIDIDMYDILYEKMITFHADIVICGYYLDYLDRTIPSCCGGEIVLYSRNEALSIILDDKQVKSFPCDKLFRKKILAIPFPKSYYYEDYRTVFKWFVSATNIVFFKSAKYHYRQRKGSISNDGDPKKDYHFFLAEVERYDYLVNHAILPEKTNEFALKVVKVGLKQAKDVIKHSRNSKQAFEYILKIRQELIKFNFIGYKVLGLNGYMKRLKLYYVPSYFYREVRLRNKLKCWKKASCVNLYE